MIPWGQWDFAAGAPIPSNTAFVLRKTTGNSKKKHSHRSLTTAAFSSFFFFILETVDFPSTHFYFKSLWKNSRPLSGFSYPLGGLSSGAADQSSVAG